MIKNVCLAVIASAALLNMHVKGTIEQVSAQPHSNQQSSINYYDVLVQTLIFKTNVDVDVSFNPFPQFTDLDC